MISYYSKSSGNELRSLVHCIRGGGAGDRLSTSDTYPFTFAMEPPLTDAVIQSGGAVSETSMTGH